MRFVVRRVLPLLAIAAITIAASCEPLKQEPIKDAPVEKTPVGDTPVEDVPPTNDPGENIASYFVLDGTDPAIPGALTRSPSNFIEPICDSATARSASAGGPGSHLVYGLPSLAAQHLNPDGSVSLVVAFPTSDSCLAATGFGVLVGPLGDLAGSTAGTTADSDPIVTALAFDADADGDFGGQFDADGTSTGLGNDVWCFVNDADDRTTIDDTTTFQCVFSDPPATGPGLAVSGLTLQDLKDGVTLGDPVVDDTTPVAIQVALPPASPSSPGPAPKLAGATGATATVDSLEINGVEQL